MVGIASSVLQAVSIAVGVYFLVSLLAQYSGGSLTQAPARIAEIRHFSHGKASCETRVEFTSASDENLSACVVPRFGKPLTRQPLRVGDTVLLTISSNVFGSVLTAVKPSTGEHAEQAAARESTGSAARGHERWLLR
jgi:hypothetical protein